MERILLSILGVLLIALPGQGRDPLEPSEIIEIIEEFQYEGNYTEISSKQKNGSRQKCWIVEKVYETKYPDMVEPLKVEMTMYIPNRKRLGDEMVPTVTMVPPIGGVNMLDKRTAKTLCSRKMASMIIANDFANIQFQANKKLLPPEDHQETYYRTSAAIKATMKMIEDDANLDYSRMGIFGVSLGGILSSFVMATQPDIAAGYFVVAGGDVPQILATSQQDEVSKIRRKRMKEENIETVEEYEAYLRTYITLDPMDLGVTMPSEALNMVISRNDANVPSKNQMDLHRAFNEPEVTYTTSDHFWTIFGFLYPNKGRNKVANFFAERFKIENPRPNAFEWLYGQLAPLF